MNWIKEYPYIAHRGLHSKDIVENSEKAFDNAVEKKFAIELDIQFLSDGTPVVFHDSGLDRLLGLQVEINSINPSFFKHLKYKDGQRLLLLAEALEIVDEKVPLLIEIKNETCCPLGIKNLSNSLKNYRGRLALQSFNPKIIQLIKATNPHFCVGQLVTNWFQVDLSWEKKLYLNFAEYYNELNFISLNLNCSKWRKLFLASFRPMPIFAWTLKSAAELGQAKEFADGFIFEGFLP